MTAWQLASLPFWILALLFLVLTLSVYPLRKPTETTVDLLSHFVVSLLVTGLMAALAAWVQH